LVVVRERRRVRAGKAAASAPGLGAMGMGADEEREGEGEGLETAGLIEGGEGVNAAKQGQGQKKKMKKVWKRMSNGEFSHVW
jgi:hypothetical protein